MPRASVRSYFLFLLPHLVPLHFRVFEFLRESPLLLQLVLVDEGLLRRDLVDVRVILDLDGAGTKAQGRHGLLDVGGGRTDGADDARASIATDGVLKDASLRKRKEKHER